MTMIDSGSSENGECEMVNEEFLRRDVFPMLYQQNKKCSKGSMLVYALVIMTVVSILLTSIISFVVSQLKFSSNRVAREEAFQVAEGGIYYYRWYLAHATDGMNAQQLEAFWQNAGTLGISGPVVENYTDPGTGDVIGQYTLTLDPPDPSSTIATVTSVGTVVGDTGVSRTVKARFRRPSWSEYAILADEFIRFGEGTEVWGKIHSNGGVRFDGLAHNSVTSLISSVDDPDHNGAVDFGVHTHASSSHPPNPPNSTVNDSFRPLEAPGSPPTNPVPTRADIFEGGRQFPVPEVSFTGVQSDLTHMKNTACNDTGSGCTVTNDCWADGCYYDNSSAGRRIVLKTDGTFDVYTVNAYDASSFSITSFIGRRSNNGASCTTNVTTSTGSNAQCQNRNLGGGVTCLCNPSNETIPDEGVIYVGDNVWLEGTIDSGVTRATVVAGVGNMFLGNNDILYTSYDGDNILGIIGQQNVEIIRYSQDNLQIDGALLAQNGRVGRSHYSSSDHRTTITINGAIATKQRYGFAWTDGSGYTNRYLNFDNNLLYYPPPYFPTGTEYSIDLWEEL